MYSQVFVGSTLPSMGASDIVQAYIGGRGLCIGTIPREHRPEESVIN